VQSTREYAIITLDPHGHITSWNAGAEAIYGYKPAEIIGKHFSYFHMPVERRRRAPASALKMASEQGVYQGEGWRVRKDGTRFWASVVVTALRDDESQLRGFSKVVRDMTVRMQYENALKKQAALLKLLQDVTVMANEATQVQDVIQFALEQICRFMGWQIGLAYEVTDTGWGALQLMPVYYMAEDSRLKYLLDACLETPLSAGEGLPGAVWATGAYVWSKDLAFEPLFTLQEAAVKASVQMSVAFPVLVGKVVTHVLQFFATQATEPDVDLLEAITHLGTQIGRLVERQNSEDALRSSEVRFRTIFQNAAIGIELVDLDGVLLACNPAIARIFGYTLEEIHTTALMQPDHDINIVHQDRNFERLRSGKLDEYTLERAYQHAAGQVIWGRSKVSLVRDANNNPQYAVCMLEDVTEQKQMEIEMREMRRRLTESREAERLHLAQELHDGPIQDLYGLTYTLKAFEDHVPQGMDTTPLKELEAGLKQVARTLRSMNGELRPPTLAPFGLEKAIRSHAQDFKEAHPELELCLNLMPDGQKFPENVRLALFRIYQASLANVLRHAEASRVEILLEFDENQVRLEICDNGKGFAMPSRWILLARKGHLGLVGAMERAEAIGGKLEVESEVGAGTRVCVLVPLGVEADPKSA
jgi:PAS domain S-box-containing protein